MLNPQSLLATKKTAAVLFFQAFLVTAPSISAEDSQSLTVTNNGKSTEENNEYSLPPKMEAQLLNDMVWIEGGSFEMGSNAEGARPREQPVHQVTLDGFYIAKTELTQDIFEQIMGWNNSYFNCEKCAVNNISWLNAQLFIERLNLATGKQFNLPTEAQWAYAAKGGQQSKGYEFSGSNDINEVAWYAGNAENRSHQVAQRKPNELGLYDMTGNLWEFCLDDMNTRAYSLTSDTNPLNNGTDDPRIRTMKVVRGSGYEFAANESEVYKRDGVTNNVRMPDIGFRLVMK